MGRDQSSHDHPATLLQPVSAKLHAVPHVCEVRPRCPPSLRSVQDRSGMHQQAQCSLATAAHISTNYGSGTAQYAGTTPRQTAMYHCGYHTPGMHNMHNPPNLPAAN